MGGKHGLEGNGGGGVKANMQGSEHTGEIGNGRPHVSPGESSGKGWGKRRGENAAGNLHPAIIQAFGWIVFVKVFCGFFFCFLLFFAVTCMFV